MKKSKAIVKVKSKSKGMKKKILPTLVNFILDKSGSMKDVLDETISGFNTYVDRLRKDTKSKYLFTLTLFDTESVDMPYVAVPLTDVRPLDRTNYVPGMSTPLFDAVGNTITLVEKNGQAEKANSVLTVIMTDGQENASREWSGDRVRQLVKDKEATGKWTFIFLGATLDAVAVGASVGASAANSRHYTARNTLNTMVAAAGSTMSYSAGMNFGSRQRKSSLHANFFKSTGYKVEGEPEEDKDLQDDTQNVQNKTA